MVGRKTGGRVAGTPNRKTRDVQELLESLDCDPIQGMARLAMNKKTRPELRARMFAELAQYVYPKRKAIEHSGAADAPVHSVHELIFVKPGDPEAKTLI
jgi:hypothetical protein